MLIVAYLWKMCFRVHKRKVTRIYGLQNSEKKHLIRLKYYIPFLYLMMDRPLKPLSIQILWMIELTMCYIQVDVMEKCCWLNCCRYCSVPAFILKDSEGIWKREINAFRLGPTWGRWAQIYRTKSEGDAIRGPGQFNAAFFQQEKSPFCITEEVSMVPDENIIVSQRYCIAVL